MSASNKDWWRGATIYQVYPRSYRDTNGDGVGDIPGITEKLPHIASLGVDAIWISPIMKSPMKDHGYDVSDYQDIDPLFGTLDDFKTMLDRAHELGLKVITDMIYSHTSDEHPWFKESRSSRDNPKADWYVWTDPKEDGNPVNNWISVFGGSSWQFHSERGQYYLHNFLKEQPDLNYHNPEVQDAMLAATRFWLDLGIDGFRLDALNFSIHDKQLRNNPGKPRQEGMKTAQLDFLDPYAMQQHIYDKSQPEMLVYLQRVRALLEEYPGTMALGEIGDDDEVGRAIEYSTDNRIHTCYNFQMIGVEPRNPAALRGIVEHFEGRAGEAWPSWAFSNHDVTRAVSKWSKKFETDPRLAKMLPALVTSLRGTAFIYQGEELGLPETKMEYGDLQDPWAKFLWPKSQGRDGCRTPMPWKSGDPSLGFSDGTARPWLPINPAYNDLAVDVQAKDPESTMSFLKSFLAWRKGEAAMITGDIKFFDTGSDKVLGFTRSKGDKTFACLFNFDEKGASVPLPKGAGNGPVFSWKGHTGAVNDNTVELPAFGFFIS